MLSTLVLSTPVSASGDRSPGLWLRTLAALVPATIEGVVRDVTLLQVGADAEVADIADEAGCGFVSAGDFPAALSRGLAGARCPWIFVLTAGTTPSRSFGEEAAFALQGETGDCLHLRETARGLARWLPRLSPVVGVIAPRARLAAKPCANFRAVVRRAHPGRPLPTGAA